MKKLLFATIFITIPSQAMKKTTQEAREARDQQIKQIRLDSDLVDAAYKGEKEKVVKLLARGAQPAPSRETSYYGCRDLHALGAAAWNKHEEICKILIAHKANVNHADAMGITPLMRAVQRAASEDNWDPATPGAICQLLIDHKAEVNAYCLTGKTPLIYACYARDQMAHDVLISHGAITDGHSIMCQAKLHAPREYSTYQQMALSEEFKVSTTSDFEPYNFMLLLAVGAHRCCDGRSGIVALAHAALNNRVGACATLLEQGVSPNDNRQSRDGSYSAVLMSAVQYNRRELAQLFIKHGAKLTGRNQDKSTALMEALRYRRPEMCELLVEALLRIPNKKQKEAIVAFLGTAKKERKTIFDTHLRASLKKQFQEALYEENKTNFAQSVAYDQIKELKECEIKKNLLEKYSSSSAQPAASSGTE